eukprot:TRINITY_DN3887_c0_g1_i1.p1 TRINITY_DN3887_c0_g1~~TRINITY_DN3887_c0_g1_i1.p1  ORF type:complete len:293 (+),score=35.53 TRINITY_DN3887_c0_g1_i1:525-1403(+)
MMMLTEHGINIGTPITFSNPKDNTLTLDNHRLLVNGKLHIQIASDLHIEFYGNNMPEPGIIIPSAPILALLGDIGAPFMSNYPRYLNQLSEQFELVLVIAGNHEFYDVYNQKEKPSVDQIHQKIQEICDQNPKLIYMHQTRVDIAEYSILGCTLWAFAHESQKRKLGNMLNDYRLIYDSNRSPITPDYTVKWHDSDVNWIRKNILEADRKSVVLTHHAPSHKIVHPGLGFSTNLEYMFKDEGYNINVWAYGHTHASCNCLVKGTQVVSNQRGYPGKTAPHYQYDPEYTITVD